MATGCFATGPPHPLRTAAAKRRFLEHFADWGILETAARYAGTHRNTVYKWQEHDPGFAAAYQQAYEQSCEIIEAEMLRRAVEGVEKPVYQGGDLVGHVREYSDTLLMNVLKARRPEKYRERIDATLRGGAEFTPLAELLAPRADQRSQ